MFPSTVGLFDGLVESWDLCCIVKRASLQNLKQFQMYFSNVYNVVCTQ